MKDKLDEFASQTGIKVSYSEVPQEAMVEKTFIELASGTGKYDVLVGSYERLGDLYPYLEPLNDYLTAEDKTDFLPGILNGCTVEGKVYALPFSIAVPALFYRTDVFKDKGLRPPETWDDLVSVAKALTNPSEGTYGYMIWSKRVEETPHMNLSYLHQAGGRVFDENYDVTINNDAGVRTVQFLTDLVNKYKVTPPNPNSLWTVDALPLFTSGKLLMASNWLYMYSVGNDASQSQVAGKFDITQMAKDKVHAVWPGGWVIVVNKASKYKDAAYKFAHFITDTDRQVYRTVKYIPAPTRRSVYDDASVRKALPYFDALLKILDSAIAYPPIKNWSEIMDAWAVAIELAMTGKLTAKEALDMAADRIKTLLPPKKA